MDEYVDEAPAGGAGGFLLKSASYEQITTAVPLHRGGRRRPQPQRRRARLIRGYATRRQACRDHGMTTPNAV
ncbi:hypothetical protein ACFV2U_02020 [Streptomyces sp. NPDC059697]|uniref:hypothetical protein n=1 Tax=Streptomyces sp. NPDC059697 TaxID=3346912 RepID=UPI0036C49F72